MSLLHAAIDASDVEASIAFYRDAFGMEPVDEVVDPDGVRQVLVGRDGEAEIQLRDVEGPVEPSGIHHLAIDADDVDAIVDPLDPECVSIAPTDVERTGHRVAFVTDPDGYTIELIEPLDG